jgi:hypothetical protein
MKPTPDALLDRLAARQHGLATRADALSCGLSDDQIDRRVASGRLVTMARGVYRVAAAPVTWRQAALAACLAGPAGTVASHLTAAALHELTSPPPISHVTVPRGTSARLRLVRVHRSPLAAADRSTIGGIPATSVARTLLDCAAVADTSRLNDLVDTAFCSGRCHPVTIPAMIDRAQAAPGRGGVPALRAAIEAWTPGVTPGSPAEMRLLRKIAEAGLELPERQIEIFDASGEFIGRIDIGWRRLRAGFEYDSDRFHNPRHWQRDETRQISYGRAGWDVRRVGKHDLMPSVTWLDDHLRRLARRLAA